MASLHSLPIELVQEIANKLDEDEILALRLACKDLDSKTHEAHLESKYRTRRVFFVPAGLDNLLKISRHPSGVNKRVKEIIFFGTSPYYCISDPDPLLPGQIPRSESASIVLSRLDSASQLDFAELQEIDRQDSGEDTSMLALAFTNLPELRSIRFHSHPCYEHPNLTRSEFNLFYPTVLGLNSKPGTHIPTGFTDVANTILRRHWGLKNSWSKFMAAVVTAGLKNITRIQNTHFWNEKGHEIPLNDFLPSQPRRLARLRTLFANLKVLEIVLRTYSRSNVSVMKRVQPWLEAIGAMLEVLDLRLIRISFGGPTIYAMNVFALPMLSFLKMVTLENFNFDLENFKQVLINCKDTLVSLKITKCKFYNNKEGWFVVLQLLKREVRSLKFFQLRGQSEAWYETNMEPPDYVLPDLLSVEGCWACESTISKELDTHRHHDDFWDSITNGEWKSEVRVATTRR
ncbi:hypothetical protein TWF970_007133 [Orbilia oligospora]|uniref:F-box domain-containing protein n=1 Tax=Orbilia oligospora TaxID=2813651 RepID=A0A7C8VLI7_ORBOL|nr:hypothetical protein TWF970_007133 [Orbilia oligospora]